MLMKFFQKICEFNCDWWRHF